MKVGILTTGALLCFGPTLDRDLSNESHKGSSQDPSTVLRYRTEKREREREPFASRTTQAASKSLAALASVVSQPPSRKGQTRSVRIYTNPTNFKIFKSKQRDVGAKSQKRKRARAASVYDTNLHLAESNVVRAFGRDSLSLSLSWMVRRSREGERSGGFPNGETRVFRACVKRLGCVGGVNLQRYTFFTGRRRSGWRAWYRRRATLSRGPA